MRNILIFLGEKIDVLDSERNKFGKVSKKLTRKVVDESDSSQKN